MTLTGRSPITMFGPDFPFPYDDWLRHPAGLGRLPRHRLGTPVAVAGGGISGLVVAYELMKLGLRPVLYEPGELGGRMRSVPFEGHPDSLAELGAMRFPTSASTLFHYLGLLGLKTRPFPNPLAPGTPSTVLDLGGVVHHVRTADELPAAYLEVGDAWEKALQDGAERSSVEDAIRRRDVPALKSVWNRLVAELDDQSFYGFLAASSAFESFRTREVFGQIGFGSGGWDTDFPNSILEVLRVVCTHADDDQVSILGGAQQLPVGLWTHPPENLAHWPAGTSLSSLNAGAVRPAVTRLSRSGEAITVEDSSGERRDFAAVVFTPHVWTLLGQVDCAPELLSVPQWTAVERTHYMNASKLFVLADRPFWRDPDPVTGRDTMGMTLTDRIPRGVYLFDDGPQRPAVMCLSYSWNDDSAKMGPLDDAQRLAIVLRQLKAIYPDVDIASHIVAGPISVTWEREPHFMGAFRANLPGHYRYQRRLYTQFMQRGLPAAQRGFFLSGDDISWTAGFAEGAVTTALNAVWGVLDHLGGATHPGNPGPGDRFAELAPVELPY
ncbi:flavin monoamine oxidase family protein [Amycolatopsis benzoatilytica]|uniref:flavin monoamine oxidase family protein n=1 Tax=Amycolatopsis benzoatilytica TaxID=346045 RepID=UPI00036CE01C|nr:NAD(P)/FAD-dependent oxidoreductase [Amycolatopsis benzoatilytica]